MCDYVIREAVIEDCDEIMCLITQLTECENKLEDLKINADVLKRDGFGTNKYFHCLVAEPLKSEIQQEAHLIGCAMFYYIYSSFVGIACYMEILYVTPEWRGKGIGTALWMEVTKIALSKKCSQLQWSVFDWNKHGIDFYKKQGSVNMTEKEGWLLFKLTTTGMHNFVSMKDKILQ